MNLRSSALALVLAAVPVGGAAQAHCTRETLIVRGSPVTVAYCVQGEPRSTTADELVVPVSATFGGPGGSYSRASELHFVAGERISRVLESVDLRTIGLDGTLHLTLAYTAGEVRVEGAMLTPGAITIK